MTCTGADELYRLTDSADIPGIIAEKRTVEYKDGVATINIKVRSQNYTIAVENKRPLKFSVGNKRGCTHADMITFNIDDQQPRDEKNPYGLHFLWRQSGDHFEVHQSDRDASSTPINLEWPKGDPKTMATVTAEGDQVTVEHQKKTESQKLCLRESNTTCSFARSEKEFDGGDVFRLKFTTHNDRKCGIFIELSSSDGHLLFPESERPSGATKQSRSPLSTSPTKDSKQSRSLTTTPSSAVSSSANSTVTAPFRASSYKHYSGLPTVACLGIAFLWHVQQAA